MPLICNYWTKLGSSGDSAYLEITPGGFELYEYVPDCSMLVIEKNPFFIFFFFFFITVFFSFTKNNNLTRIFAFKRKLLLF